jgi:hypothetical protein
VAQVSLTPHIQYARKGRPTKGIRMKLRQ